MHLLILRDVSKTELLFSWTNIPALVNGFTVHDYPFVKISQKFNYQFFSPVVLFPFYHNVNVFFVVVYFSFHPNTCRIKVGLCLCVVLGRWRWGGKGGRGVRGGGRSMHVH